MNHYPHSGPCSGSSRALAACSGPDVVACDECGEMVPDGSVIIEGGLRICERCADDAATEAAMEEDREQ